MRPSFTNRGSPSCRNWRFKTWIPAVVVSMATFILAMDVALIPVALPTINQDLHPTFEQTQWIVSAYNLTDMGSLLASGPLADRYGRRRVMTFGLTVLLVGYLVCGLSDGPLLLLVGRAIEGVGAGAVLTPGVAILSHEFRGKERGTAFAMWGVAIGFGTAVGPVISGFWVDAISWRWIFLMNVPVVVALAVATLLWLSESHGDTKSQFDWGGLLVGVGAVSSLAFAITEGAGRGWGSPVIVTAFSATGGLIVLFVQIEINHKFPIFDLSVFRIRAFTAAHILIAASSLSYWPLLVFVPLFLSGALHYQSWQIGLMLLPLTLPLLLLPPMSARLVRALGARRVLSAGIGLVCLGTAAMLGLREVIGEHTALFCGLLMAGIGSGLINVEMSSLAIAASPPSRVGMAAGVNMAFRHGMFAIGVAIIGAIWADGLHTDLGRCVVTSSAHVSTSGPLAPSELSSFTQFVAIWMTTQNHDCQYVQVSSAYSVALAAQCVVALVGTVSMLWLLRDLTPPSSNAR